jgi:integrase
VVAGVYVGIVAFPPDSNPPRYPSREQRTNEQVGYAQPPVIETLGQLADHLLVVREHQVKPATLLKEADFLNLWLNALGRGTRLDHLTEEHFYAARTKVLKGRKPSTVNSSFAVLRTYLNWAFNKGIMRQAPHRTVKKLKEPKAHHSKLWWTTDDVDLALRCAAEDHHQPTAVLLIAMGCLLGMRWEEMIMQRWQDLDLDAVAPDGTPAPVCYIVAHDGWEPKDGESRPVPIHARLHALFLQHRKATGYVLEPDHKNKRRGGTVGVYRYDPWAVWARVLKRVIGAGGKRISPHGMRHSFASNLLIAGVSDVLVSRWMGHSDTSQVHERYGHLQAYHKGINQVELSPVKTGEG